MTRRGMSESFSYKDPSGVVLTVTKNPDGSAGLRIAEGATVEMEPAEMEAISNWLLGRASMPS